MHPAPTTSTSYAGFFIALVMSACIIALLEPSWAQDDEPGGQDGSGGTQVLPAMGIGSSSDSNNRMIAVTGVDLTGQSILYLVDTESQMLCVYQASGGSKSTRGIRFVGARRIGYDLQLDGFNDKTESNGSPLGYKDLKQMFEAGSVETDR